MVKKNKYIVTVISFAIVFVFIYLSYKSGKNQEYPGLSIAIRLLIWYLIALIAGIIAVIRMQQRVKLNKSVILYNLIGSLNVSISIAGLIFIYIEGGNLFNTNIIFLILSFLVGLVIFKGIYKKV